MQTQTIDPSRVGFALERIDSKDGFLFEEFSNQFLAYEFPDLRPVAGIHDGGRDAFIHSPNGEPTVFVQHSVTANWAGKIKRTIRDLQNNGHRVQQLVFCSPGDVQRHADDLKRELRQNGVVLDVRDYEYFKTHANTHPSRVAACERLALRKVEPILKDKSIVAGVPAVLTSNEERAVIGFLQLSLEEKNPQKGVMKFGYEALIKYILRKATSAAPMSRADIHKQMSAIVLRMPEQVLKDRVDGALERLAKEGYLKHHTQKDAFATAYDQLLDLDSRITKLGAARQQVLSDIADRIVLLAKQEGLDYALPLAETSEDVLTVAEQFLFQEGEAAALAFSKDRFYRTEKAGLQEFAESLLAKKNGLRSISSLSHEQFLDIIPLAAADIIARPTDAIWKRLSHSTNSYWLFFVLRQTQAVQDGLNRLIGHMSLLVDASVLVPCLAEEALGNDGPMRSLLRAAVAAGVNMIVTQDVIDELCAHIKSARAAVYNQPTGHEPELARAYRAGNAQQLGSFEDFISRFVGDQDPKKDLQEYLEAELGLKFDPLSEVYSKLPSVDVEALCTEWKAQRRERPDIDEMFLDLLVQHDVKALLAVEQLRIRDHHEESYGHRWWWLTLDRTAYRVQSVREHRQGGVSVCMSPEFFNRYLSIVPTTPSKGESLVDRLPLSLEVAALDLIAPELPREAVAAGAKNEPPYLQRRRVRDLMAKARKVALAAEH